MEEVCDDLDRMEEALKAIKPYKLYRKRKRDRPT